MGHREDYKRCMSVEKKGLAVMMPYLDEMSDGRLVLTDKGALSRKLQLEAGDLLLNDRKTGQLLAVELKTEERHTGNLYLETWSNRNLEHRRDHAERGSNPGWMVHSRADLLLYLFLDRMKLYVADLFELKRWAFGSNGQPGRIYQYHERDQKRTKQLNDTWGRCVPIKVLAGDLGWERFRSADLDQQALF